MKKVVLSLAVATAMLTACSENSQDKMENAADSVGMVAENAGDSLKAAFNSSDDAVDTANERNDAKFDDSPLENASDFAVKVAEGGMVEVEFSKLAQKKTTNADVKKLAAMMIEDHTKANNELKALAKTKNITLPKAIGEGRQKDMQDLSAKTGADFDKAYVTYMVKDHKEDIRLFERQSNKGEDADTKSWAAKTLPTLRHHLEMVEQTERVVNP